MLRKRITRARDDFIALGTPVEASVVASDLSRVVYPARSEIIKIMGETIDKADAALPRCNLETRKAFLPVRDAMEAVRQAADDNVMAMCSCEFKSRMRVTIERLRETANKVAGGKLLPCLLEWPGVEADRIKAAC